MNSLQNTIRSMSFNIRYDNPEDGGNGWQFRRNMVSSIFRFHRIDIAGLQEVLNNQLHDLEERLPDYGWIGAGREDGVEAGEFVPVFYLRERFQPVDHGLFWLSETPDLPGSTGWDASCTRIATWVRFSDLQTGKMLYFFNTHFDHVGINAMRKSAFLLLKRIEKLAGKFPVIVTGDFNNTEDSEVYGILTGRDAKCGLNEGILKDSRYECIHEHHGPTITFHDFDAADYFYRMSKKGICSNMQNDTNKMIIIDYIFIKNGVKVIQHGVLSDTWDGRYPSDHMPVVADLVVG